LIGGPVRAGAHMDLLFRSTGFDPRQKMTRGQALQGRALLRCTARVAGQDEPYVTVLDTGVQPLQ
jgi:hypothetical protein